eukprot:TRINITY_DN7993_c3_g1_i1.p1 TRINITY_DN7993_c3_g1~~TRINITY_DN7993_c3_g1_i1.p1  ORF type:complete len:456 (+),score=99.18 TRINITY_DN7993_c3_g1_i1:207-1574(+)
MSIPVLPMQRAQVPLSGQQGVELQQYPIPTYVGNSVQGVASPATHNPYDQQQQQQQQTNLQQQQTQATTHHVQHPVQLGGQPVVTAMPSAFLQQAIPPAGSTAVSQTDPAIGQPIPTLTDSPLIQQQQQQQQQYQQQQLQQQQFQRVQPAGVQIAQAPTHAQGLVPSFPVFSMPTLQNAQTANAMLPMGMMNQQLGLPSFPVMSVPTLPTVQQQQQYQPTAVTTVRPAEVPESEYPPEARDYPGQGAWPEGLAYIPNFVTEEEEKWLIQYAYSNQWDEQGKMNRRVCQYGYLFDYESGNKLKKGKPMPPVFQFLIERIASISERTAGRGAYPIRCEDNTPWVPNQIIVNEYLPGQGIGMHIDKPQLFDQNILTLILNCPVALKLIPKGPRKRSHVFRELLLKKRALFSLTGPSRYTHQHGIPSTKIDVVNGTRNKRGTCIAITFRRVLPNATISD